MMDWTGSLLLVAGAALCLLAAAGVLRLPDFFMRMHAATKAGVVGCGLILLGVGFADGTASTWVKVILAIAFLVLTTPVAGHLLGRAAYVGGAPFWQGTADNGLEKVLPRGRFDGAADGGARGSGAAGPRTGDRTRAASSGHGEIRTVTLALANGRHADAAIDEAIALARRHGAAICGLAIIDAPRLANVGPIPIGAGWHAQQMRERRLREARRAAADVIERFEQRASTAGLAWSVRLEEGKPHRILAQTATPQTLIAVAREAWFDHGVLDLKVDVARRLRWSGLGRIPLVVLG